MLLSRSQTAAISTELENFMQAAKLLEILWLAEIPFYGKPPENIPARTCTVAHSSEYEVWRTDE